MSTVSSNAGAIVDVFTVITRFSELFVKAAREAGKEGIESPAADYLRRYVLEALWRGNNVASSVAEVKQVMTANESLGFDTQSKAVEDFLTAKYGYPKASPRRKLPPAYTVSTNQIPLRLAIDLRCTISMRPSEFPPQVQLRINAIYRIISAFQKVPSARLPRQVIEDLWQTMAQERINNVGMYNGPRKLWSAEARGILVNKLIQKKHSEASIARYFDGLPDSLSHPGSLTTEVGRQLGAKNSEIKRFLQLEHVVPMHTISLLANEIVADAAQKREDPRPRLEEALSRCFRYVVLSKREADELDGEDKAGVPHQLLSRADEQALIDHYRNRNRNGLTDKQLAMHIWSRFSDDFLNEIKLDTLNGDLAQFYPSSSPRHR